MDPKELVVDKKYKTTGLIKVCLYDVKGHDCEFTDKVDLPSGTELTYIGPDNDDNGGDVFENAESTKFCLHDNDLTSIEEIS